jgi:hyperosmotically inducible periplasmic protein
MNTHSRLRRMAGVAVLGIAAGGLTGLTACDRDRGSKVADADNTARNTRDRDERTATPLDQGESEGDRTITQHIRKAVTSNDTLSTNAHNVKIITQNGVVTLRGPVETPQEKSVVVAAAQGAPGVKRVDDQLEVKATN